jgi:hypothetical protein
MQELATLRQQVAQLEAAVAMHQQAEEALRASAEHIRMAIQCGGMGTWDIDLRTGKTVWSDTHFTLLGYEPAPHGVATMDMWRSRVHPEDLEAVLHKIKRAQRERAPFHADYRIIRADTGEVVWLSAAGRCFYNAEGEAVRFTGVFFDITERKRTESMLARYYLLSEQARDIILFMRRDGQIVEANHAAVTAYGYDRATLLTMNIYDLRDPVTAPLVAPQMTQADTRGILFETMHRHKDGSGFPVEVNSIGADIGGERLLLSIIRDITARKQAEAALRESEARFRALTEAVPAIVWTAAPDGTIIFANEQWFRYCGLTPEQNAKRWPELVLHPDDRDRCLAAWTQALAHGMTYEIEVRNRRYDGVYRWFLTRAIPVRDAAGDLIAWYGTSTDIHDRKCAEEALQQAHAELEQRVQERTAALRHEMAERQRLEREAQRAQHFALLGRLAAGVSHEIRNPLGAVFLHVDLLEEELQQPTPDSPAQVGQSLAEIKTQLARLDELVQDYLSLVRVATIQREPQDLGAAVQAWAAEMQGLLAARGVALQLHGLAHLGLVAVHVSTLRRAVVNLVQNALDAMPHGGTVTLEGQGTETHAQLLVRDTGSGMPAERLTQIFEPLYTTKPGGTGLGLYIVQEIVAAHGGRVTVESVEGQGTTFTITLPRAAAKAYLSY